MSNPPDARLDAVMPDVVRNRARSRYEIHVDGAVVGFATYHEDGGRRVFPHTEVDDARQGQGLAGALVRAALQRFSQQSPASPGRDGLPSPGGEESKRPEADERRAEPERGRGRGLLAARQLYRQPL